MIDVPNAARKIKGEIASLSWPKSQVTVVPPAIELLKAAGLLRFRSPGTPLRGLQPALALIYLPMFRSANRERWPSDHFAGQDCGKRVARRQMAALKEACEWLAVPRVQFEPQYVAFPICIYAIERSMPRFGFVEQSLVDLRRRRYGEEVSNIVVAALETSKMTLT